MLTVCSCCAVLPSVFLQSNSYFIKGVTYKQHDSDEEEYDDFGRKKKKFRGKVGEGELAPSKWGKPPSMTTVTKNNGNNLCFLTKKQSHSGVEANSRGRKLH